MLDSDASSLRTPKKGLIGDRAKIIIMGGLLGMIVLAYVWPERVTNSNKPVVMRPRPIDLTAFQPDPKILANIKDATTTERGTGVEFRVWEHLLRKSYNIGPAAAEGLGLTKQPASVARLREDPGANRGRYVWLKGRLEKFEQQKLHPIPRAKAYKGRLRTEGGDQVIFWVSQPLPESVSGEKNPWVRVEGFFVKIVDEHYVNDKVLNAPLIIGPRIDKAFPDWEPVRKIDQKVLAQVPNAIWDEQASDWINTRDWATFLVDSQNVPLWHLASHALYEQERTAESHERHDIVFELPEQYTAFKLGQVERGAKFRLRGTFIQARVYKANVNPVGIEYWTSAWIRVARMGAKMLPIWIPRDIGEWTVGEQVDVDAFYFKNRAYEAHDSSVVHTPQFVAASLTRFKMESHPMTKWVGLAFAVFVIFLSLLFFRMSRRAKAESEEYKAKLIERRQKRRSTQPGSLQAES